MMRRGTTEVRFELTDSQEAEQHEAICNRTRGGKIAVIALGTLLGIGLGLVPVWQGKPASGASEAIRFHWMSGAHFVRPDWTSWFCGTRGPSDNHLGAWDLIATDETVRGACGQWAWTFGGRRPVYLNTLVYSQTSHVTLAVFPQQKQQGAGVCDIFVLNTVEISTNILRGHIRYVHAVVTRTGGINVPAAPGYGATQSVEVGQLVDDTLDYEGSTRCSTGWHLHQDNKQHGTTTLVGAVNTNIVPGEVRDVWHPYHFIHKWCYTEGRAGVTDSC